MNLRQITSDINAAKARLEQVKNSEHFQEAEREKLIIKYEKEISDLEAVKADAASGLEVNDPKIL